MKKIFAFLLFAFVLSSLAAAQSDPAANNAANAIAITNATVIDVKSGKSRRNQTIMVNGNRIVAVGKTGKIKIPTDARIVDGSGKFLIPGLWDMHVHFWDANAFYPIALANGITGLRDMGDELGTMAAYRRQIETGERVAPRLVFGGQIIDGLRRDNVSFLFDYAQTPDAGREFVRRRKAAGADFVKVYSHLTPDVFAAVADESKKQNLPFAGHIPVTVGVREAARAGQRSIEHLRGFAVAAASDETNRIAESRRLLDQMQEIDRERAAATGERAKELAKKSYDLAGRIYAVNDEQAFDFYDARKAAELIRYLKQTKTWQVPTLAVIGGNQTRADAAALQAERLIYFPQFVRGMISGDGAPTAEKLAEMKRRFQVKLQIVRRMHRAGIKILAGSDTPNNSVYPGFSLHDELELLVQAGLTPLAALRSATSAPAEFLGRERELGAIEAGKLADLVLLDANPLYDIKNTAKIRAVVADGRLLTRDALDRMLADAAKRNQPKTNDNPTKQ